jgi:2-polyprenyl-3-methyl-5-hydroxy-6-metoxy-1,4-benzoquinol methylase
MQRCILCDIGINNKRHIKTKLINHKSIGQRIYLCSNCLIAFTYPPPKLPVYEYLDFHLYTKGNEFFNNHLTEISELPSDWEKLIEVQTSIVINFLPSGARILEIGCGEGILLNELNICGFSVCGIEPSNSAYIRAKDRNLNIINGSFPDVRIEGYFDLVVMSQVLEHIKDLDAFIDEIKRIIPYGYLLLTQTNFKGLIPYIQKEKWYGWVPEQHFWHFTLKGLTGLLAKHDFEMVENKYSSLCHPHNLLYKIAALKSNWQDQFTVLYKLKTDK